MAHENLGEAVLRLTTDQTGLVRGFARGEARSREFVRRTQRIVNRIAKLTAVAIVAIGAMSVKLAADFDTSMTRIETLVGLSREQVQGMRSDVLALSRETARAPKELADALFVVNSAGLRGAESLQVLEQSAKAAAIGLGQTGEIARSVTSIVQAYGAEHMNASKAVNQLIATVREGNLEASSLAPVLGRVIGLAAQMDISFAEVGASIATFTRLGVNAEEAVTGLRGILNALIKATPEAKKQFKALGTSIEEVRRSVRERGLAQTLIDLIRLTEGNEEALGNMIPNVRALATVLGTAGVQGNEYVRIARSIANSTDLLGEGFERVAATPGFKFQQTLSTLKSIGIEIGNVLLPVLSDVLRGFNSWVQTNQDLIETKIDVWVGTVAAGIGKIAGFLEKHGDILGKLFVVGTIEAIVIKLVALVAALNPLSAALTGLSLGLGAVYIAATEAAKKQQELFEAALERASKGKKVTVEELTKLKEALQLSTEQAEQLFKALGIEKIPPMPGLPPITIGKDTGKQLQQNTRDIREQTRQAEQEIHRAYLRMAVDVRDLGMTTKDVFGTAADIMTGKFRETEKQVEQLKENVWLTREDLYALQFAIDPFASALAECVWYGEKLEDAFENAGRYLMAMVTRALVLKATIVAIEKLLAAFGGGGIIGGVLNFLKGVFSTAVPSAQYGMDFIAQQEGILRFHPDEHIKITPAGQEQTQIDVYVEVVASPEFQEHEFLEWNIREVNKRHIRRAGIN